MFRLIAFILMGLALLGWLVYQLLIKQRTLRDLKHEMVFIVLFIGIWIAIYYWAMHD